MDILEEKISIKINILRTLMIVFVLFIHNTNTIVGVKEQLSIFYWIQQINLYLFSPAVPILYFISAYLLFMKQRNYKDVMVRRVKQVLIPFILWPTIVLLLYLIFNYKGIRYYSIFDYVDVYLGVLNRKGMLLPHFWFLRDLFILTLFYPLMRRKYFDFIFFVLSLIWLFSGKSFILGYNSLFYFILGYFAAKHNFNFFSSEEKNYKNTLFWGGGDYYTVYKY